MSKKVLVLIALVVLINSLMFTTGIFAEDDTLKPSIMSIKPQIGDVDGNGNVNSTDPNDSNWPRTKALWGLHFDDIGDGDVSLERNVVANRRDNGVNNGIKNQAGVKYINNIQYKWGGGIDDMTNSSWTDPNRSIESYHGSLGKTPTFEAFIDVVRNRGLKEWPKEYTAYSVNEYIREGFNLNK